MRAVRYHGPKQPLKVEEVPAPTAGPGQVVVEVKAAGLCHRELNFLSGLLNLGVQPVTLGHEVVGRVAEVGAGVTNVGEGDRVIVYYYVGCGRCRHCLVGDENLCGALQAEYGSSRMADLQARSRSRPATASPFPTTCVTWRRRR